MNYEKKAYEFLSSCGVLFKADIAVPQKSPLWAEDGNHGVHWSIMLKKVSDDKVIEFSYWGSIADREKQSRVTRPLRPTPYEVLAWVYNPVEDFDDFCDSYGYNNDSIKVLKTYKEIVKINEKIESIFTSEQIDKLIDIA